MSITIRDKSPKTYIILGMHKGGTSFISKALHRRGVDMGWPEMDDLHYEDQNFLKLNRKILKEAGGTGNGLNPPSQKSIEKAVKNHKDEIMKLIKTKPFWGFKTPQSSLTLKPMLKYFKDDVYLICVFRKPKKVSESLYKSPWHKISKKGAKKLTLRYYNNILAIIKEFLKK